MLIGLSGLLEKVTYVRRRLWTSRNVREQDNIFGTVWPYKAIAGPYIWEKLHIRERERQLGFNCYLGISLKMVGFDIDRKDW